jgi:2-phospho-L-lactate transferase/gluconeogenesis factor (CofD/UPF0052 family)
MTAEPAFATRSWPAGRYRCTLTMQRPRPGALTNCTIEWAPAQPARLTPDELRQYRSGRDQALAEISAELGINAAVVEV